MPSVFFETFGCQMNVADSDMLVHALLARGFYNTESSLRRRPDCCQYMQRTGTCGDARENAYRSIRAS